MIKKLIHTPEGVRDIYGKEYAGKLAVEDLIHNQLNLFGYQDIQTPTFEYFDVFSNEIGTTPSKELYKFFDKEGNTLVLRPDFTPSMARCAAKYFMDENMPIRFCYAGNTFTNTRSLICAQAGLDEQTENELRELISGKNIFGAEELLAGCGVDDSYCKALLKVTDYFGTVEVLKEAEKFALNSRSHLAIDRLFKLYQVLCMYGVEKYVSFDLGMLSKYHYYTGVIFKVYTYGVGEPIVKGGRYDHLLGYFGKESSAIGFAVVIDDLMLALSRQKAGIKAADEITYLSYNSDNYESRLSEAKGLRKNGRKVSLIPEKKKL